MKISREKIMRGNNNGKEKKLRISLNKISIQLEHVPGNEKTEPHMQEKHRQLQSVKPLMPLDSF